MTSQDQIPIDEKSSLRDVAMRWLFGQEANTVALYALLVAIGYAMWYALNTGIPLHLKQIHDGYKEISEGHIAAEKRLEDTFDKSLDRIERLLLRTAPEKVDKPHPGHSE